MEKIFLLFCISISIGCNNNTKQKAIIIPDSSLLKKTSMEDVYNKSFDITNLKLYNDSSKFIARLYLQNLNHNTFIELTEFINGIDLCVKQPITEISDYDKVDSSHSLPFNQLCYSFSDSEAKQILSKFLPYNTHSKKVDIKCPDCINHHQWFIEIYDHGKYSYYKNDSYIKADEEFINFLLKKVQLNVKNNFKIINCY